MKTHRSDWLHKTTNQISQLTTNQITSYMYHLEWYIGHSPLSLPLLHYHENNEAITKQSFKD